VKEFRCLALKGVADELKNPADEEQRQPIHPQPVEENAGDKNRARKKDGRDAKRVTHPIYRMLMTGSVLRDPLLVSASAQHAHDDNTKEKDRVIERSGHVAVESQKLLNFDGPMTRWSDDPMIC
jgi:transposase